MPTVQVSARILAWPQRCACCMGEAGAEFTVTYTRYSGRRVRKAEEKGWDVPYCAACVTHVDAHAEAAYWKGRRRPSPPVEAAAVVGSAAIVGLVVALCAGLGGSLLAGILLALGVIAGGVLLARLAYGRAVRKAKELEAQTEGWLARTRGALSRDCCAPHQAVEYEGWAGSVHTFHFYNEAYARAFVEANEKKVLG